MEQVPEWAGRLLTEMSQLQKDNAMIREETVTGVSSTRALLEAILKEMGGLRQDLGQGLLEIVELTRANAGTQIAILDVQTAILNVQTGILGKLEGIHGALAQIDHRLEIRGKGHNNSN